MALRFFYILVLPLIILFFQPVQAHKVLHASAVLTLNTEEERTFELSVATAVESSGNQALDDEIGPEDAARMFVENNLVVEIDGKPQPLNLETRIEEETDPDTPIELKRLSVIVNWTGTLPNDGKEIAIYHDEASELTIILATVKNEVTKRRVQVIYPQEYSRAENIEPLLKGNPFEIADPAAKTPASEAFSKEPTGFSPGKDSFLAGAKSVFQPMWFPFCLLVAFILLVKDLKKVVLPLVVFVIAQSLGLVMTSFGLLPNFSWGGAAGFLALLVLAIDNLASKEFRRWRLVTGGIGAFFLGNWMVQSGPILSIGGPRLPLSQLLPFQIGFELIVLLIAIGLGIGIKSMSNWKFFRPAVLIPVSLLLAGTALYLLVGDFSGI